MPAVEEPKNPVASSSEDDVSDEGDEHQESGEGDEDASGHSENRGKQNRNEKKARKAIMRHGMKHMPNIDRVMLKKSKNVVFSIVQPDVYKSLTSDTYIIFGTAKMEDLASQAHSEAAQRFTQAANMMPSTKIEEVCSSKSENKSKTEEAGSAQIDEEGIEPKDIQLVMSQADCSREQAVTALRECGNDIVEAIMQLSTSNML